MKSPSEFLNARSKSLSGLIATCMVALIPLVAHGQDRDRRSEVVRRVEPGTTISVRTNDTINVDRGDNRVYRGIVDQDVREGERIEIPRGAPVELMVRVVPDNDLLLDLDSIVVNGERLAVKAAPNRVESSRDTGIVGAVVGALGGEVRGRAVRVPRDSVVTFRLERPLDVGVPDRGYDRDGVHYHGDDPDRQR